METEEHVELETTTDRRGFLAGAIYTLTSIIAAGLGVPIGRYLLGSPRNQSKAAWADAGDISGLDKGSPQELTFDRVRIDGWKTRTERASAWVLLNQNGGVTAFSPLCTHLGCAYRWETKRKQFLCPCHGSVFSRSGQVISGPAPRPLDRYEVKLEGTRLWVGPIQRSSEFNGA